MQRASVISEVRAHLQFLGNYGIHALMGRFRDSIGMWLTGLGLFGGILYAWSYSILGLEGYALILHRNVPVLNIWMSPFGLMGLPFIILFCGGALLMRDKK